MTPNEASSNRERVITVASGWVMLPFLLALILGDVAMFIYSIAGARFEQPLILPLVLSLLLFPAFLFLTAGLDPFAARVVVAKSPCGFRAAYQQRAQRIMVVKAAGCAPPAAARSSVRSATAR